MTPTERQALIARCPEVEIVFAELDRCRRSQRQYVKMIVEAGIPLEAIRASVTWELTDELKRTIVEVTDKIREIAAYAIDRGEIDRVLEGKP
jgi:hypothetical protein